MASDKVLDLKVSEYLTSSDTLEGAGLQDTLAFAIKREQQSVDFYSKMKAIARDEAATQLCERLTEEELRHKSRLEKFYDDLFYNED